MADNELSLKPVSELLEEDFYIPAYQRGYRWTSRQVEDLLNDIRDFQRDSESRTKETFYCLQPLVIKRAVKEWELVDGQQRLTTIYLILHYLKDIVKLLNKSCYSLRYETRKGSADFLQNIDFEKKDDNIDYYHICNAYETIQKWFEKQDGPYRLKFLQTLLNDDETGKNVKVIWYDIKETIDPVEVFTRLNIGKIPLTNAELVKALFLRSRNFSEGVITSQQLKIAQEWDAIEKALQADELWYFMHNDDPYANRIENILLLIAKDIRDERVTQQDTYYTFMVFSNLFSLDGISSESEWDRIKKYFMTIEEWYRDRYLYHLVGFLIDQGVGIPDIKRDGESVDTKQVFRRLLKERVFSALFGRAEQLAEYLNGDGLQEFIEDKLNDWNYQSNKDRIRTALLLFNIATLVRNTESNLRFQFDSYKKDSWDLEHVRSVKSEKPERIDNQKAWLENVLAYFTGTNDAEIQTKIVNELPSRREQIICQQMLLALGSSPFDSILFDRIYEVLLKHFREGKDRDTDNSIGNLALLDAHTNRGYKNAVFPIKRKSILALDKDGTFVPLCTKNVFLKYYSHKIDHMMFWSEKDRSAYFSAIIEMLVWFFKHESEAN